MGILNMGKLAQVKMKFTSAILIGISASLARADWGPGGGFGGYGNGGDWGNNWGWGGAPDCAKTCFSSIFQTHAPLTGHGGVGSMAMDGEVTGVAKAQMESLPSPLRVDRLRVSPREPSQ